ncbi:GDSL-type esterase/lipase family protein [Paenarthrobacter nicotinovorans]|uniref:GDSL-type esterase/lipase family protein n=1 Tax=Paenarthrobacter nicotinovorans TaxID=29320 RepID=UPI002484F514|nr:GDSL-type esterase/lipase family protein [Paenarthrobacter nicotinovorans]MDI2019610.1 hypothetical protein [Paenarthrobacter nicotinovorans]
MPDYPYRMQLAEDAAAPGSVARNAAISFYAATDTAGTALLALKDPSGNPLANPLTTTPDGFVPALIAPADEVRWEGGGFHGFLTSYEGLKAEAVSAVAAANEAAASAAGAAANAAEAVASALAGAVSEAEAAAESAAAAAGLVGAPADTAIAAAITAAGSATKTALSATNATQIAAALDNAKVGADVDQLTTWGDSLTFSQGSTAGNDWPTVAAGILGIPRTNNGKAGWASTDVAALMGAIDLALTVSGNTIPVSGPVPVTMGTTGAFRKSSGANLTWPGTLAGIPGTLTHVQSGDTWTFTRTSSGAATACPPGTPFHATLGDAKRNDIVTIWVGRNNLLDSNDPYQVVRDTDLMVRRLTSRGRRYLVIGMTNATSEPTGHANLTTILAINTLLAKRHGDKFVDIRAHLVQKGMDEVGLYVDGAASASIAQNTIPAALMTDSVHPNNSGYLAIAKKIARTIASFGWVTGAIPSADPVSTVYTPPSLGVSDIVSRFNAQAITGTAVDGVMSTWADLNGAHNMAFPTGSPTLRQLNNKRYVDLGAGGGTAGSLSSTGWDSKDTDFTLAVALKWDAPDTVAERFVGSSGTSGIIQISSSGVLGLWGGASPTLNAGAATAPGWHTIIAVFNGASSAIYLDGALLISGTVGTASLASSIGVRGTAATKTGIADFAYVNHAVTAGEVAALHAGLASSIPV